MRSPWIIQMSPKSEDKCPYKRHTEERRGEGHVKAEAEVGGMWPPAKECLELSDTGTGGKDPPLAHPHQRLGFGLLDTTVTQ